jgi:two-component system chemotaxis sensor kinase CheA
MENDRMVGFRGLIRDVSERRETIDKLEYMSMHDSLTGLYNRSYFEEEMRRLENSRRNPVALILFDVDGLKLVNDTLGHDKGDQLLLQSARIIGECFRKEDVAARVGGDEFAAIFKYRDRDEIENMFLTTAFVESIEIAELKNNAGEVLNETAAISENNSVRTNELYADDSSKQTKKQNIISVQLNKLDKLLDLVGELVISESMVTNNPDLTEIKNLDNFSKAARQHRKVIHEIQDIVMSIRMVPLAGTFQKMNRIVRDMSKKLDKQVELTIQGEETEVDKNIIEHLSDPIMHLIRNSIDHGIETAQERADQNKPVVGKVQLEAKNEGGDVWITIRDDGSGLNKEKILSRALEHGLINRAETELSDQEIFAFILLPGFSTNTEVTEFSGRGVGMDVVAKNIEEIGGSVYVDSKINMGTVVSLKIPLTLAIINGMGIRVGKSTYTVPITSIRESFKSKPEDVFTDPDGVEMIMVRGECLPILRLHKVYGIQTAVTEVYEGIIMIVETDNRSMCLFADELIGEQQVVVKALPKYLKKIKGIGGCTLLGDGKSSLILDVAGLMDF